MMERRMMDRMMVESMIHSQHVLPMERIQPEISEREKKLFLAKFCDSVTVSKHKTVS